MERLSIIERTCGCPLYDQIWTWKADERSPSTPCQLIQFFYQFSKDMGGGAVQRICFESSSSEEKLSHNTQLKRGAYPRYGISQHHHTNRSQNIRQKSMNMGSQTRALEMYVAHNEQIIATIFVNRDYDKSCDKILHQILTEFTQHYSDIMIALMPSFIQQSKTPDDATMNISFMSKFSTFGEIISKYAWNHNTSRPSHVMQVAQPSDRVGSLNGIGGDADGASIRINTSRQQDDDHDDLTTRHGTNTIIDEDEENTEMTLKTMTSTTSSQPSPQLTATQNNTTTINGVEMTTPNQSNKEQATLLIRTPSMERNSNNNNIATSSTATATAVAATLLPAPRPTNRSRASRASKSRPAKSTTPTPNTIPITLSTPITATLTAPTPQPLTTSSSDEFTFTTFDSGDESKDVHGRTTTHTRYQISPSQSPPQLHTTLTSNHPKESGGRSSSVSMSLMNGIHPQVRASHGDEDDVDGYG